MLYFLSALIRLILYNPRSIIFEKYDTKYFTLPITNVAEYKSKSGLHLEWNPDLFGRSLLEICPPAGGWNLELFLNAVHRRYRI